MRLMTDLISRSQGCQGEKNFKVQLQVVFFRYFVILNFVFWLHSWTPSCTAHTAFAWLWHVFILREIIHVLSD